MLRSLYERVIRLAAGPWAIPALAAVAMIEATVPFVPPDIMLAPMVLARRERAWLYAAICTAGSVGGGLIGYALGYFLAPLGLRLLTATGHPEALASFQHLFDEYGLWVILVKGLTPVPYMLVTIASGVARFSMLMFVAASIATRGGRFFLGAALMQHPNARAVIERHLHLLAAAGVALIVAALLLVRWIEHHA
jgi:membrane protein YqaA with SNARE-associated domain